MFEHLLRPGQINSMTTRHRIMVAPMEKSMALPDGSLSERYIEYVTERARGGASLIQLESTYVDAGGRGNPFQLGCHDDVVIPALRRLSTTLHELGSQLSLELHHGGRQASPTASGRQPMAPSPIGSSTMGPGAIPREMTQADIDDVIAAYAAAAQRCLASGVDMINLHGAHGYLLGQFLSPQSNVRSDRYGGSLRNRARFSLDVLAAVRAVVGPDYPIGYRLSAVEFVENGLELDESIEFALMLADAGIDLIDVAGGTYESMSKIFQSASAPRGGFIDFAAAIKRAVGDRVAVGVAQKLNDPLFTEQAMIDHDIDFVSLARGFHADPHFVRKLEQGRPDDILPCIGCNACVWMSVGRTPVLCAANPHSNFEETRRMTTARSPRQILVVGGGVGGMHAARILARQGHQVALREAGDRLGGQINQSLLTQPDHQSLRDWLERQLVKHGVDVACGTTVSVEDVRAFGPDAVVVATGAAGSSSRLVTDDGLIPVLDLFAAYERPRDLWGEDVVITTGDAASCNLALLLAQRGHRVHVLDASASLASDRPWPLDEEVLEQLHATPGIHLHELSTAESIVGGSVVAQRSGERVVIAADAVVTGGRVSRFALAESLRSHHIGATVISIGDAVKPRDVFWASFEAAEAAATISTSIALRSPLGAQS